MAKATKEKFNWGPFLKQLAIIAIPISLQHLLTTTGTMIDTAMISDLGEEAVGAVGLCGQFNSLLISAFWGFMSCGMLFMSQYWGAKNEDGLLRSYGLMWTMMMLVSALFCVAATCFPDFVLSVFTDKENIRALGVEYIRIVGFNYPLMVFTCAAGAFLRSTERVRVPLYASILGVITNVFLNWVLIGGNLGAPALGIKGAAIATVVGGAVNLLFCLIVSRISGFKYMFRLSRHFKWTKPFLKEFFVKCFPILCNEIMIGVFNAIVAIIFGHQSEEAIAAVAVITTFEGIFISFFEGFSNAGSILVGKAVGAGELEEGYRRSPRIILVLALILAVLCVTFVLVCEPVFKLMGLHDGSLDLAKQMAIVFAFAMTFRMTNWVNNDIHRAGGDAVTGTVAEIVTNYAINIPLLILAAYGFHAPFALIYAMRYADEPLRSAFMTIHLLRGRWVQPVTEIGRKALPEFEARHGIRRKTKISKNI